MSTKDKFKIDPNRVYNFELQGAGKNHKGRYIIRTESVVYDPEKGTYREVRLCPTEKSPYVDEQKEGARVSNQPIIFHKGRLSISGREEYKINYLLALDQNADKVGAKSKSIFKYRLIDEEKLYKKLADDKMLKLKVQVKLAEASKEDLADFLKAEYNYEPKTDTREELLNKALAYAEVNPQHVLDTFSTEATRLKAVVLDALKDGTLKNVKGVLTWGATGTEIKTFKVTPNNKLEDQIVEWVGNGSKEATDFANKLGYKK